MFDPADRLPVSLFTVPDGSGMPLSDCVLQGGERTDATIEFVIQDGDGLPVAGVPAEEIWLESTGGGLVTCAGGALADGPTDATGLARFSGPLHGGGATTDDGSDRLVVVIQGAGSFETGRLILVNGPDLDGDLVVDLNDVVAFARIWFGSYDYAADFDWDGAITTADLARLAGAMRARCP